MSTSNRDSATFTLRDDTTQVDIPGPDEEKANPSSEVMDGGWKAWSIVLGVWLSQFCTIGYSNSYGVYNDFYVREYLGMRYTASQISWIGSVQQLLLLSTGILFGRAFDAGYFHSLRIGGSLLFVFCLFMLSLSQPGQYYQVFLAQGLGMGIAMGMTYIPGLAVISHYFRRRRALAMGIAVSGSAVGGMLHPIMLNQLFHGPVGFHGGVRASAALAFGLFAISLLLVKPKPGMTIKQRNSVFKDIREFLSEIPYLAMVIGAFLFNIAYFFPIFFLQLNAIENGLAPAFAFYTLVIYNGASLFGRVMPTLLVPKFGIYNTIIPCVFICGVLMLSVIAVRDVTGTVVFAVLYGFFSGGYAGLCTPMAGSIGKADSEIGVRIGILFTSSGFGALIGAPIAGALLSTSFVWWKPVVFTGLCAMGGGLAFLVTRHMTAKAKGTPWV